MSLQIRRITDPSEFVANIQQDQNDYLYLYQEKIFEPIDNIFERIITTYEQYLCGVIFTDIQTNQNNTISPQYFNDLHSSVEKKVIYSPVISRYAPVPLKVYDELEYHSFSFLQQCCKFVLPWHIPVIGFDMTIDQDNFKRLAEDASWVMQHVT